MEPVLAKRKAQRCAAGERLWKTLGTLLDEFFPAECANFLQGPAMSYRRIENALASDGPSAPLPDWA